MSYFIGLDVSKRRTGLVVLSADGAVLLRETIGATAAQRPAATLRQRIEYYREIAERIHILLLPYTGKSVLCVEGYAMHSPGDPTIAPELGGIVRNYLLLGFDPIEVPPQHVKMLATGKGNAKKDEVMAGAFARWGFDCGGDDNLADAYTLAQWALGKRPAPKAAAVKTKMPKLTSNLAPKPAKAAKGGAKAATPQPAESIGGIPTAVLPF